MKPLIALAISILPLIFIFIKILIKRANGLTQVNLHLNRMNDFLVNGDEKKAREEFDILTWKSMQFSEVNTCMEKLPITDRNIRCLAFMKSISDIEHAAFQKDPSLKGELYRRVISVDSSTTSHIDFDQKLNDEDVNTDIPPCPINENSIANKGRRLLVTITICTTVVGLLIFVIRMAGESNNTAYLNEYSNESFESSTPTAYPYLNENNYDSSAPVLNQATTAAIENKNESIFSLEDVINKGTFSYEQKIVSPVMLGGNNLSSFDSSQPINESAANSVDSIMARDWDHCEAALVGGDQVEEKRFSAVLKLMKESSLTYPQARSVSIRICAGQQAAMNLLGETSGYAAWKVEVNHQRKGRDDLKGASVAATYWRAAKTFANRIAETK